MVALRFSWTGLSFALVACNVAATDPGLGGVDAGTSMPGCAASFAVTDSDYTTTNVSIVSPAGKVLAASIVSSASAPAGLTTALSGDVVSPLARPPSGRLVLLDRYPNAVITWIDPATGLVLRQLPVGTGFSSNPHDYLEVSADKAYVTRYETNAAAGKEPFDTGGDVLVVDTKTYAIVGSIPLASDDDGEFLPRPDRVILNGAEAWVSLGRLDASFATAGDARIAGIDTATDTRTFTLDLPGMASCGGLAIAPSGKVVALACSGVLGATEPTLDRSGVVLLDATVHPPKELARFPVATLRKAPVASSLAFASEQILVGVVFGDASTLRNDAAYTIDVTTGAVSDLASAGAPFALGDVRCTPGCGDRCLLADANANALRVFQLHDGALEETAQVNPDSEIGLPPRGLGEL